MSYLFHRWSTLLFVAVALLLPKVAHAHAMLQRSNPAPEAVVTRNADGHLPVELTFNSRIDAQHSSITLIAGGKTVHLVIDPKAAPNVLRSESASVAPGACALQWQVVAGDGHISRGSVSFRVR